MTKRTTDFQEFLDGEDFSSDNFDLIYELYCLVEGAEERGTYKSAMDGDVLVLTSPGNAYQLALVSPAAVEAFKIHVRHRYMQGMDADSWYASKIHNKNRN